VTRDRTRERRAWFAFSPGLGLGTALAPVTYSMDLRRLAQANAMASPRRSSTIFVRAPLPLPLHFRHQPFPSHQGHACPTRFPDPLWSIPQFLQVCLLTGRLRGACATHHTPLLVPNVEIGGLVTLAPQMGSAHRPDALCASRAFTRGDSPQFSTREGCLICVYKNNLFAISDRFRDLHLP
jgi:hypothetical protein